MYQWFGILVFPELRRFPPGEPRREAWRRAEKAVPQRPAWVAATGLVAAFVACYICFPGAVRPELPFLLCFVLQASITWWYRQRVSRVLRADLNARGSRLCVDCGYDLVRSPSSVCSECGSLFVPPPPAPAPPETAAKSAPAILPRERRPLPPRLLG